MHFVPLKKETSNYSKCSAFASYALLHLFFAVRFVEGGRGRERPSYRPGYPSYATAET